MKIRFTLCMAIAFLALFIVTNVSRAQTSLAGDANGDGKVDGIDYITWVTNYNTNVTGSSKGDFNSSGKVDGQDYIIWLSNYGKVITATPTPHATGTGTPAQYPEGMSMHLWQVGAKNVPNPLYDKCDDGTDIVTAHKQYYVIAYDGIKYPTWHPPVVTNPITNVGKCYFGHEHGSDPQKYMYWAEMYQHFGKDLNNDGTISPLVINAQTGVITPGDRAGIPFGIANEHMDKYYNQEGRDSIFVRHEDHVGHKIEFVNKEADSNTSIDGNVTSSTHEMAQLAGTNGLNIPYYTTGSETYKPTGVVCTHLHKFHQGTHSGDAIRNNLHEVIFHSNCGSVDTSGIDAPAYYPSNTVLLTGMMAFGRPGEYTRTCFNNRDTRVCPDGGTSPHCTVNDPLISKLPSGINSTAQGRGMSDRYCAENWATLNPGNNFFAPYEIWEGDLRIETASHDMLAEHGRQWDVLDPIRFVDPLSSTGFSYNAANCTSTGVYAKIQFIGGCNSRTQNVAWDSPQSGFKGINRTTYFGRNRVSNPNGAQIWWTDPLGGNAVTAQFTSGLKQKISPVEADIQKVQSRVQQLFGGNNFLNDRAIQRSFTFGTNTVHSPN